MKYYNFFLLKIGKMSPNLSSAAVVIGALRVRKKILKIKKNAKRTVKRSKGASREEKTGRNFILNTYPKYEVYPQPTLSWYRFTVCKVLV